MRENTITSNSLARSQVVENKAEAWEWRFVAATTIFVLVITTLPYIYAYASAPADKQFMGIMFNVPDHVQYFSWMRELTTAPLAANKLTPEPNAPVFFNLLWWAMGRIGGLLGLNYAAMFQVLRVAVTLAFLPAVYWLCAWFFADRTARRLAFLIAIFSAGFGWALIVLKYLLQVEEFPLWAELLVFIVEPNTFMNILSTPHLIGAALYIVVFALILRGETTGQWRYAVAAGMFALFIGWQHTYDLIVVYGILGVYALLKLVRDRRLPAYLIKSLVIVGLLSCSAAIYSVLLTSLDPVWRGVLAQFDNAGVFTPSIWLLPVLMGPAFLLAFFTAIRANPLHLTQFDDKNLFLASWFWANLVLLYIPTNYQIKMLNGWQVPIAILATQGFFRHILPALENFARRHWRWTPAILQRAAIAALLLAVIPTNLYLWAWRFVDLGRHEYSYYLKQDELSAFRWLEANAQPDDVVLSSVTMGQYIPVLTGAHAFLAHWAQTLDFYGKTDMVNQFFARETDDVRRKQTLMLYNVDYVFYGPAEQALGNFAPETAGYLSPVFSNSTVTVYAVNFATP